MTPPGAVTKSRSGAQGRVRGKRLRIRQQLERDHVRSTREFDIAWFEAVRQNWPWHIAPWPLRKSA